VGPRENVRFLRTTLGKDGAEKLLTPPPGHLPKLANWISSALETWRPRRKDDPFSRPDWCAFEQWLERELEPVLGNNGHLVVIEHTGLGGMPWHVAARRWTCSYAACWSDLVAISETSPTEPDSIGSLLVPRYRENEDVVAALQKSAAHAASLAASQCLRHELPSAVASDRAAFEGLMARCSVAQLLCHGYRITKDFEVGVILAHNGTLPILESALTGPLGRPYRLDWIDCWSLRKTPPVVFSAACGSGYVHVAGMSERFGLYAGLRRGGCRSFVAPRWILFVEDTLPVLNRALDLYIQDKLSVCQAVHRACREAEADRPLRLAWNIAVEGDFR
jgi:hypothetical protein